MPLEDESKVLEKLPNEASRAYCAAVKLRLQSIDKNATIATSSEVPLI